MKITSPAFSHGGHIPSEYTCEGQNISPEFSWSDVPKEAKSLVLILHDPDAPRQGGFIHWVVFNIPHDVDHIPSNVPHSNAKQAFGLQGKNDSGKLGYIGPCPPSGEHRYFARLYALRSKLDLQAGATYQDVVSALEGKVIEEAETMGTYQKKARKAA